MVFVRFAAAVIVMLLLFQSAMAGFAAQVVGSTWTSPTYGFTVSWAGTNWQADPAGTLTAAGPERLDRVHLVNGASSLYFEGATRYEGNLAACVAEEANILSRESGVSDVRPYRDADGVELVADGPDASAAAFTLTLDVGGQQLELVDYVECRTLLPGEAVLIITLVTDPGSFEAELASAQQVADTITLPAEIELGPLESYGDWVAAAQEQPGIAGPRSGEIAFGPGVLGVERIGVDTTDFYARAEFTNPEPASLDAWDFGIGFRDGGGEDQLRLVVDSAGNWFLKDGLGPVIANGSLVDVDTSPNGTNIIEIVAVGEKGFFAFNERLVSELALPAVSAGGDIFVGAGFFTEDALDDGTTEYNDFAVWSLSGLAAREPGAAAAPLGAAALEAAISAATATAPLAGPTSGGLAHMAGAAAIEPAGIEVEDFVASTTFVNPTAAAETPWDIGIAFREQQNGDHYRLTVASDGTWEYQIGLQPALSGGALPALNYAAGARNTIDLVVSGDRAGFAVNGAFVSSLDASALPGPGDVWVGAGFHRSNATEGNVTRFENFTIWALEELPPAASVPVPAATPAATPVAEPIQMIPREVALRLHEQNDSGIDALAVLRDTDGRTAISVVARDATGGEIVALHLASCDDALTSPLRLLEPLNAQGSSESTIATRLGDLNDGKHAIAIHRGVTDNTVIACGVIPAQE